MTPMETTMTTTEIDFTKPLFTVENFDFEDPDDEAEADLQLRLDALAEAFDVWVGSGLRLSAGPKDAVERRWDLENPSEEDAWTAGTVRVGMVTEDASPWGVRGLYVAALFDGAEGAERLFGKPGSKKGAREAERRVLACLRVSQAFRLPEERPDWCLLAEPSGGRSFENLWSKPASLAKQDVAQTNYQELRSEFEARGGAPDSVPSVALMYQWSAEEVIGPTPQLVVEKIEAAFVYMRMVIEDLTAAPTKRHPMVVEARRSIRANRLLKVCAYPDDFVFPGDMIPPEQAEYDLLEPMVKGLDGSGASEWPEIVWAHLLRLRREAGIGLAGLWDLVDPLK